MPNHANTNQSHACDALAYAHTYKHPMPEYDIIWTQREIELMRNARAGMKPDINELAKAIDILEKAFKELISELELDNRDICDLKEKVEDIDERLSEVVDHVGLDNDDDHEPEKCARVLYLEKQIERITAERNAYEARNLALVEHINHVGDDSLKATITKLEKALANRNSHIKKQDELIIDLQKQLTQKRRLEVDLHNAIQRDRQSNLDNTTLSAEVQALKHENFKLKYEVDSLMDKLKIYIRNDSSAKVNCS